MKAFKKLLPVLLALWAGPALADIAYTQGSGTIIYDFTCFTTKHCTAHVPINSAGTEIFTAALPAQVSIANTGQNATPIKVDNSGVTQPISGTIAATQSGNWNTRIQDGSGNPLTSANRGSERPLSVQILDATGNQITSFGGSGGTASNYTSTFPANGTAIGFSDGVNMQAARVFDLDTTGGTQYNIGVNLRASGSGGGVELGVAAAPLQVSLANTAANATAVKTDGSAVTQPVSGTVTANAGTNLNTSALALDTSVAGLSLSQGSTTSGQKGLLPFGAVTTAAPTYTTGQSSPLSLTTAGELRVTQTTTQPVSGTIACSNCSGSGLAQTDASTFTPGAAASFASAGGFFQTTATNNALTNLQMGAFQVTANRALFSNLRNAAGAEVGVAAVPLQVSLANTAANATAVKVDGSAVTQPVSVASAVNVASATAPVSTMNSSNSSNGITSPAAGVFDDTSPTTITENNFGYLRMSANRNLYGTIRDAAGNERGANVNSSNQLSVSVDAIANSTGGATGATVPTNAGLAGVRAQNAEPTAVTNGQLVAAAADLTGKQIVLPYANPENSLNGIITTAMTGTTSTAVTGMGAQGAGVRNYVTGCTVSNSHATVGTDVRLQDGSGGTVLAILPAAPAYGGAVATYPTPLKTTANTGLFAVNVTTGASTTLSCTGYKGI